MYTLIIRGRGIVLSLRRRRIWKCNGYITFEKDKCGELLRMVIPNFLPNLKFVEMYFDNVKCARYTAQLKTGGKKWFKYLLKLRPLGVVNVIIVYCQHSSVTSASANLQNTIGMPTENNPKIEAKRPRSSQDIQEYAKSWELRTSGGPE